ncbi:MAG: hypothetical protein D3922_01715, partial [Candidatus Electrothrix sp. AR1]|nr:hypothetical protein [Candidatus Electrothrix sp. AR1]
MNKLSLSLRIVLRLCLGTACLLILFIFSGFLFSSGQDAEEPSSHNIKAQEAELATLKDQFIDPDNVMRVQVEVDYSEGKKGAWYPKAESPVLTPLVEQGALPPVAERVGEEPLVLKGLHGVANYGGSMYRLNKVPAPRITPINLVRFSPQGFPIVPNV